MNRRTSGLALLLALGSCAPPDPSQGRKGDIAMVGGYALSPAGPEAVAYVSLRNRGRRVDTLLSISSPFAAEVTLHDSQQVGGMVHMVRQDRLVLLPGMAVEMAPGSLHLMLTSLRVALPVGHMLPLRFRFARAGELEVEIPISRYGETH